MHTNTLKALPLALLLAAFSTAASAAADEPSAKKETTVVVAEDDDFPSADEPFVRVLPGRAGQARIGVRLLDMTPELRSHYGAPRDAGVLVADVEKDSPAAKAGVRVGDIITRAGGEHVETAADLARAVRHAKAGESLKLEISRDRASTQATVKVERRRGYAMDLGELGRDLGRDLGREIGRHAWAFRDGAIVFRDRRLPENLDRLRDKLDEMEKRLRDLEKQLPPR